MVFRTKYFPVPAFVLLVAMAGGAAAVAACSVEPDPGLNPQPLPPGSPPDQAKSPNDDRSDEEATSSSSGFGGGSSSSSSGSGATPSSDAGAADASDAKND